jgi:hypothetical protein
MTIICPNCRDQLSRQDFAFIVSTLATPTDGQFLQELLVDAETRDLILDTEELGRALLDLPGFVHISPQLYFYVLVRRNLRGAGIEEREIADYVASVLVSFICRDRTRRSLPENVCDDSYSFELLAALGHADEATSFQLRGYIGNRSLFLTGLWADRLRARTERKGAPDIRFYQQLGAGCFQVASHNRLAGEFEVERVYETLGERFHETRLALNEMAERHLAIGDLQPPETPLLN